MSENIVSEERTDIDKLISFLKYVNSDYIDIKDIRKDLKNAKKNHNNDYNKED